VGAARTGAGGAALFGAGLLELVVVVVVELELGGVALGARL